MQIVIDIDEETYKDIKKGTISFRDIPLESVNAIANGVPLPKGHGELIDRNELEKDLITNEWITSDDGEGLEDILFHVQTIIEADIESGDNNDADRTRQDNKSNETRIITRY